MKPEARTGAPLAALLILLAGCEGPAPAVFLPPPPAESSGTDPFGYRAVPLESRSRRLRTGPGGTAFQVTLSLPTRPGEPELRAVYTLPRESSGPFPVVILLPALAGDHRVSDFFVEYLNRRGIACLQPRPERDLLAPGQPLEVTRELIRRRVVRTRWFLEWLVQRPEIDTARMGVMGVSLGAMVASLVAATEDRLLCAVLLLGGGDLGEILARSADPGVRRYRRSLMRAAGWTETRLRREAARRLGPVDPLRYADHLDRDRTLFVEALFDRVIPSRSRREFWSRAGRPPRVLLPAGHYSSLLLVPYVRWKTHRFLATQFETPPALAEAVED